jgi:hypothetical protein
MALGLEELLKSSTLHNPAVIQDDDLIHVCEGRFDWNLIAKEPVALVQPPLLGYVEKWRPEARGILLVDSGL